MTKEHKVCQGKFSELNPDDVKLLTLEQNKIIAFLKSGVIIEEEFTDRAGVSAALREWALRSVHFTDSQSTSLDKLSAELGGH